jgi:hypothetical protein
MQRGLYLAPFDELADPRLLAELLSVEAFNTLLEAQVLVEEWRIEYNTSGPTAPSADRTPTAYAKSRTANQHAPDPVDQQPGSGQPRTGLTLGTSWSHCCQVGTWSFYWPCHPRAMSSAHEFPESTLGWGLLGQRLCCAVVVDVVGPAGMPAGPDHSWPGAQQDADGLG